MTSLPIKHDSEKNRLDLIPPEFVLAAGRAFTYGARKYGDHNWEGGLELHRLMGALLRHIMAFQSHELIDSESGLSHLDHAAASLAMLIATYERSLSCKAAKPANSTSNEEPLSLEEANRLLHVYSSLDPRLDLRKRLKESPSSEGPHESYTLQLTKQEYDLLIATTRTSASVGHPTTES